MKSHNLKWPWTKSRTRIEKKKSWHKLTRDYRFWDLGVGSSKPAKLVKIAGQRYSNRARLRWRCLKYAEHMGRPLLLFVQATVVSLCSGCSTRLENTSRAHTCRVKLLRSWVWIPAGDGLFSFLLYPISSVSLIQAPHVGATLLITLKNMLSQAAWGKASLIRTDWEKTFVSLAITKITRQDMITAIISTVLCSRCHNSNPGRYIVWFSSLLSFPSKNRDVLIQVPQGG